MKSSRTKLQLSMLPRKINVQTYRLLQLCIFLIVCLLCNAFFLRLDRDSLQGNEHVSMPSIYEKLLSSHSNRETVPYSFRGKSSNHALDCEACGPRRPKWISIVAMARLLQEFVEIYENRPFKHNSGGMLFEHSFFLFFTLRTIQPKPSVIIESGAHKGHTSWLIKETMPNILLISISPEAPKMWQSGVTYLVDKNFSDFNAINWNNWAFKKEDAFVLLDDHQDNFRRIFVEGYRFGFRRFIIDDNWGYPGGDSLSLRWVCERKRKELWRGWFMDNFNRLKINQTWEEHLVQGDHMKKHTRFYFGFMPLFPEGRPLDALISMLSKASVNEILKGQGKSQFSRRVLMTYIETK